MANHDGGRFAVGFGSAVTILRITGFKWFSQPIALASQVVSVYTQPQHF